MRVRSVTGWPSPTFDLFASAQLLKGFLAAGFYYKTFKWPTWRVFEPLIKRSTGFGRIDAKARPSAKAVRHVYDTCDVLIIGGGPAGLAAARSLASSGQTVVLADDQPNLGGCFKWEDATIGSLQAQAWLEAVEGELSCSPNVKLLRHTTVAAAYENNCFVCVQTVIEGGGRHSERFWRINARNVVVATGAIDRPMMFPDNDRPGIMMASAIRRLLGEYAVAPGKRLAIFANNDSGYATALAAAQAGLDVVCVVDTRSKEQATGASLAIAAGIECLFESEIASTRGYKRLSDIKIRSRVSGKTKVVACDSLAVSGGFTPVIQLACQVGRRPVFDAERGMFIVADAPDSWTLVGGAAGTLNLEVTLQQGYEAGRALGGSKHAPPERVSAVAVEVSGSLEGPSEGDPAHIWVDLQNDVKLSDVQIAAAENYVSVEHLKRYTTLGMGTDQGRTSNVNGLSVMAALTKRSIDSVGTTTFRPPYTPVRFGTIANGRQGDLYMPQRLLPAHDFHMEKSAIMEDFGWRRPDWYAANGADREQAIASEMAAVREGVGVFDASSLGKIEISGPDAAEFLSRFYVSDIRSLKPGRIRYSVMLKEDGVVFDDGVVTRLSDNLFLAGPTSGNADAVMAWFERWRQTEWPSMRVAICSVTSNWAAVAFAGPRARDLLASLNPDFDISAEAFQHMQVREGLLDGVPTRIARVSFTGELQFEVSVPTRYAGSLLKSAIRKTGSLSPVLIGMEAWLRLRLEKGYLHVGADTNGRTTPHDIGMGQVADKRKGDFIGRRSLDLSFNRSDDRERLVGVVAENGPLQVGGRVMKAGHTNAPCPTDGYVTSATFSPSCQQWIGLALIERGDQRQGEIVSVFCAGRIVRCKITRPAFYDPSNTRLNS